MRLDDAQIVDAAIYLCVKLKMFDTIIPLSISFQSSGIRF